MWLLTARSPVRTRLGEKPPLLLHRHHGNTKLTRPSMIPTFTHTHSADVHHGLLPASYWWYPSQALRLQGPPCGQPPNGYASVDSPYSTALCENERIIRSPTVSPHDDTTPMCCSGHGPAVECREGLVELDVPLRLLRSWQSNEYTLMPAHR